MGDLKARTKAKANARVKEKLMRIKELAEATGVSAQTIHYYLREGLLPPPIKTAPNMAYYGPEHVDDIRLIKELQEKRYLPLSVIKLVLAAKREGKDVSQLQDMRLSLEDLFRPLGPEEEMQPMALVELVAMTGLPAATLEALEEIGLLMPTGTLDGKRFDGLDVRIARAVNQLLGLGLTPSDLGFYRQYIEALQTEARVIREKVLHGPERGRRFSGMQVKETLDSLKSSLAAKVYRQAALEFGREEESGLRSE
ncbi:MAG: MerR family transcriptional regulator [Armatimonadetes bacterium]|nr:MerR family transcriptional regulator [Armatimonadota bacterium]